MAKFTSDTKIIQYSVTDVFSVLSDLNNLELVKEHIPQDKIDEFSFDKDSCTISVNPIGKVRFVVTERVENSLIRLQAEQVPFATSMSLKLDTVGDNTQLELLVDADLNPFIKPMVSKPLQQGLDKIAEMLASLPYHNLNNPK